MASEEFDAWARNMLVEINGRTFRVETQIDNLRQDRAQDMAETRRQLQAHSDRIAPLEAWNRRAQVRRDVFKWLGGGSLVGLLSMWAALQFPTLDGLITIISVFWS